MRGLSALKGSETANAHALLTPLSNTNAIADPHAEPDALQPARATAPAERTHRRPIARSWMCCSTPSAEGRTNSQAERRAGQTLLET